MFNITPNGKRAIAREWLILLALTILSPVPVSFIRWTHEGLGMFLTDDSDWFARVQQSAKYEDAYRTEHFIAHPERLEFVRAGDGNLHRLIDRRSFADYLFHKMKHPATYLDVLYVYPIYLLICSIIWAVRLLKRQEAV